MIRRTLAILALAGTAAFFGSAPTPALADGPAVKIRFSVQADQDGTWRMRWSQPQRHGRQDDSIRKTIRVHQPIVNGRVPLRQWAGLDGRYRGYRVTNVIVNTRPNAGRGVVRLVADGQVVDRARNRHAARIHLDPGRRDVIGQDFRALQLDVRGRVFVRSIELQLERPDRRYRIRH